MRAMIIHDYVFRMDFVVGLYRQRVQETYEKRIENNDSVHVLFFKNLAFNIILFFKAIGAQLTVEILKEVIIGLLVSLFPILKVVKLVLWIVKAILRVLFSHLQIFLVAFYEKHKERIKYMFLTIGRKIKTLFGMYELQSTNIQEF